MNSLPASIAILTGHRAVSYFCRMTAKELIEKLQLTPHPEGGFFREVYRSDGMIRRKALPPVFGGERNFCTSIYYLLQAGDFSAFHRIKSDEIWHFYAGGNLLLHLLDEERGYAKMELGSDLAGDTVFQAVMPAGVWFAAEPADGTAFTLAGCTVSPGFDFADFEMAKKEYLRARFPELDALIHRLCR